VLPQHPTKTQKRPRTDENPEMFYEREGVTPPPERKVIKAFENSRRLLLRRPSR